jgi:hypothetical protein
MYIDDGGGGSAQIQSIMDSMNAFAGAAASGGFEVSEKAGNDLIGAINGFQEWLNERSDLLMYLEQERKLGASNGAKVMTPYVQQVATDGQGFITQLQALRESLNKAKEGIDKAMQNYRETDAAKQASMKSIEI